MHEERDRNKVPAILQAQFIIKVVSRMRCQVLFPAENED